ncbi:helix-turn-helix domain-containing protein [Azospirillum brasilense]|uniref:helix-turn-helix transcriptional regulator n=1 Tax=Azospirillum argentinense TaxID=2970906 RepID=UPI00190E86AC|nr:helix-turn-helix transcriptional regulator [Azospirillum argentinense]MBK3804235.1 helix-turn-helix domain-containing protein [Azospirillum argentinense]
MQKPESNGQRLSRHLREARRQIGLTQQEVADRLGRNRGRLSELEAGLSEGRSMRDRLSLLLEISEVLGVVPMLVPRSRVVDVEALLEDRPVFPGAGSLPRVFDEVFVNFSGDEEEE